MLQIEEVGKLPQVNVDQRVKGAIKFAQVGKEAALTLLQSATDPHHQLRRVFLGYFLLSPTGSFETHNGLKLLWSNTMA